jgi:hypothetical protein
MNAVEKGRFVYLRIVYLYFKFRTVRSFQFRIALHIAILYVINRHR